MNPTITSLITEAYESAERLCPYVIESMQGVTTIRCDHARFFLKRDPDGSTQTLHFRLLTPEEKNIFDCPEMLLLDRFSLLPLHQRYEILSDMADLVRIFHPTLRGKF